MILYKTINVHDFSICFSINRIPSVTFFLYMNMSLNQSGMPMIPSQFFANKKTTSPVD